MTTTARIPAWQLTPSEAMDELFTIGPLSSTTRSVELAIATQALARLQTIAATHQLPTTGTRPELIQRIVLRRKLFSVCKKINEQFQCEERWKPNNVTRRIDTAFAAATRVWNIIDDSEEPEWQWKILADLCPWFFLDPDNVNTAQFYYPGDPGDLLGMPEPAEEL